MEAIFYNRLNKNTVQCDVCHHHCVIPNTKTGLCGVRYNNDGTLYALNYEQTISVHIDPIEKKPLYHFMPGTTTYSLATVGCNMACPWCQNHDISQVKYVGYRLPGKRITADEHLHDVLKRQIPSISYTYTEPTIFIEYALEIMKRATEQGIKNVWVTNGYMTNDVLNAIVPYLDAVNIDYKSADDTISKQFCNTYATPVLDNIKTLYQKGVHVEVATLIVPGVNDSEEQLRTIAKQLSNISKDIPWHISRYFPNYKFTHIPKTPIDTLQTAFRIGQEEGLTTIHFGNV
jgi:pyruvate formate lyase activating enzyme